MEQINLAKFNFNEDDIVKGAATIKKAIDELKRAQTELTKANKTSSTEYVKNQATLKTLNAEYNNHIKALSASQKETQEATTRNQKLELVLNQEVDTIKEAREQNKLLNQLRDETNVTTEEGRKQLELLNAKLDENNELIKENVDAYTKQKINIGNYKNDIKEALEEVNIFSGGINNLGGNLVKVAGNAKEAGGATNLLGNVLGTATRSLWALTKASLSFIATPVGAILAIIAGAFLLIKNAMDRSEESTNRLKKAFAPFLGIIDKVMELLEPLGEFLIDFIVFSLELTEKAIYKTIEAFAALLDFIGLDSWANALNEFNASIQEGAQNAKDLADAESELEKMQRKARLTQLEYQKTAETLRQQRDDESKSISERIQLNRELGAVLEQQLQDELRIAQQALLVANLRIQVEGEIKVALDAQSDALTEIADIEERINGQRSEMLSNENSLRREAQQKAAEAAQKRIDQMKAELDLFIEQQGFKAKTLEEELAIERQVSDQKLEILKAELEAKKLTLTEYNAEVLALQNELGLKMAEVASDNALRELEVYRDQIKKKQELEGFLDDAMLKQKIELNNQLLEQEQAYQALRLEQGLINQDEFNKAINELNEANRINNEELQKERDQIKKDEALELRALEFEEEIARMLEENATKYEIEQAQADEQRRLDMEKAQADREQGLISEELYQARLASIDRKYKQGQKEREQILAQQKLDIASGLFGAAAQFIDKESAAGKAIAGAQAAIGMYQGIAQSLKLGWPASIPGIAFSAATGLKAILDIAKTKVPSASGSGSVSGAGTGGASTSGRSGINVTGSGVNLSALGSNNSVVQGQIEANAQSRGVADAVGRAAEEGTRRGAETGSQQGITNLSDNRQIQEQSSF